MSSISNIGSMSRSSGVVTAKGDDFSVKTGKLKYGFSVIKSVFKRTENKQTKTQFMKSIKSEYRLSDSQLKTISKMVSAKRGTPLSLKDAKQAISFAEKNTERTGKRLVFGEGRGLWENSQPSIKFNAPPKVLEEQKPVLSKEEEKQILQDLDFEIVELEDNSSVLDTSIGISEQEEKQALQDLDQAFGESEGVLPEGLSSSSSIQTNEFSGINILDTPIEMSEEEEKQTWQDLDQMLGEFKGVLQEGPSSSSFMQNNEFAGINILDNSTEFGKVSWTPVVDDMKIDIDDEVDNVLSMFDDDLKHQAKIENEANEVLSMLENAMDKGSDDKIETKPHFEDESVNLSEVDDMISDLNDGESKLDNDLMNLFDDMIGDKKN